MKSSLCLTWSLLVGLFLLTSNAEAARATTLILGKSKPEPKIDTPPTAEEEATVSASSDSQLTNETASAGNVTKLTGVPQIDYIYDPNLPRELNGYNLTDYPFYNSVPEDIDFKCDGLHDGFYASIPHKCQVYHHCLFGTRYDFLCANYTAFDQKTFICHFASEVDCKNSPKYFKRNEALYKAQSTTTLPPPIPAILTSGARRPQDGQGGRKRRPGSRRRKPIYDYYDDYEESAEQDYYDDGHSARKRKRPRPHNKDYDATEEKEEEEEKPSPSGPNKSLYDRPRIAPKIRRPVPINEREKYDYGTDSRAILAKEPIIEKTRYDNRESETRKGNHRPDNYESTGQANTKIKEPDENRANRDQDQMAYDYENDRERDRDRERTREKNHGRDGYESDRERERNRDNGRDDYESDRERDRFRDRDRDAERPYRERRPPKRRRRPDEEDDYEYEDVRRYRNRNRQRYDEYDDYYDYDERPYRPRHRDFDYRSREHDYDRDKGYRNRDPDYDRPRHRDRNRDDKPIRNRDADSRPGRDDRPSRNREDDMSLKTRESDDEYYRGDEDRLGRNKNKPAHRSENKSDKNTRTRERETERYYGQSESKSVIRNEYENERDAEKSSEFELKSQTSVDDGKSRPNTRQEPEKNTRTQESSRNSESSYDEVSRSEKPYRNREATERPVRGRTPTSQTDSTPDDQTKTQEPETTVLKFGNSRTTEKPQFRGRTGTTQKLKIPTTEKEPPEEVSEEEKQTGPGPVRSDTKAQPEQVSSGIRKPGGGKRVSFARPVTTTVSSPDIPKRQATPIAEAKVPQILDPIEPSEKSKHDATKQRDHSKVPESEPREEYSATKVQSETSIPVTTKRPEVVSEAPKFKVPFDDQESEELAPQAPKVFQSSSRRRPFLPSRGGNPTLPRGLQPVGSKALSAPRGFKKGENTEETNKNEPKSTTPSVSSNAPSKPTSPTIEFRAKLTTAIGVHQPKLSGALYEHDFTGSDPPVNYYRNIEIGQDHRGDYYENFRPLIIHAQQPKQKTVPDSYRQDSQSAQKAPIPSTFQDSEEESSIIQAGSEVKDSLQHRPIPISQSKAPILFTGANQQLGPQTFYSDNPKFKTTVTIPEHYVQKPTASTLHYHTATHLPIYQPGIQSSFGVNIRPDNSQKDYILAKANENHKPLIIKFPPPEKESLDDTDEYDVSLNDALQPISTLHPRNAPTGIFLSQTPRVHYTNGFKRRNHQAPQPPHLYLDQGELSERHHIPKRIRIETRSAPHHKKTLVQRPDASTIHQRYALPPGLYHAMKSDSSKPNFFAILS